MTLSILVSKQFSQPGCGAWSWQGDAELSSIGRIIRNKYHGLGACVVKPLYISDTMLARYRVNFLCQDATPPTTLVGTARKIVNSFYVVIQWKKSVVENATDYEPILVKLN